MFLLLVDCNSLFVICIQDMLSFPDLCNQGQFLPLTFLIHFSTKGAALVVTKSYGKYKLILFFFL